VSAPIVVRGFLGWGNRKGDLEAYGEGGRWAPAIRAGEPAGDLLGDALERAGAHEGATLLVIAVNRHGDASILDDLAAWLDNRQEAGQ
jgi:hypothetical protein